MKRRFRRNATYELHDDLSKRPQAEDGFGLGLALVASIATVHRATVHATAVPTGGLDITVRLPRRERAQDSSEAVAPLLREEDQRGLHPSADVL
jgi:K+-sensing histidine kinase KdpD